MKMGACLVLFAVLFTLSAHCSCYQLRVVVHDDGKTKTSEFDVMDEEIPPFDVPRAKSVKYTETFVRNMIQDVHSSTNDRGAAQSITRRKDGFSTIIPLAAISDKSRSGFLGNARVKRSKPDKWCNTTGSSSKAITIAKGDAIHLPCQKCIGETSKLYSPMQWVKLHPNPDRNNLYLVKEVVSDMHDDEKRNNLVVNLKHTLIIRKARKIDTGSYICKSFTSDQFVKRRMAWEDLQRWIAEDSRMRYFYHLDVIDFDKSPMMETGKSSDISTLAPVDMVPENLVIYTKWLPWGTCSLCDKIGMRQRIGLCVLEKRNTALRVPHTYLNNILDFAKHGLPCHSEYLKEFDRRGWLDRPNEVEFAECFEQCPKNTRRRKRATISVKEMSQSYEKETKKKKVINVKVDEYLVLKCPGSKLLKKPVWMLGSETISQIQMRKLTNRRVNFDILGSIHFIQVKLNDTGVYSCWIAKKVIKKFDVRVRESQFKEVLKYGKYLGVSLVLDFLIFLFLAIIKSCHRRVQVRRKSKKQSSKSQEEIRTVEDSIADQDHVPRL